MYIQKRIIFIIAFALLLSLVLTAGVLAGAMDSPGPPTGPDAAVQDAQMFTLADIYNRLASGTAGTKMTTFTEPIAGPGSTMRSLDEIMEAAPDLSPNGAVSADVEDGKTFWGLTNGEWGPQVGSRQDLVIVYGETTCSLTLCVSIACCESDQTVLIGGSTGFMDVEGNPTSAEYTAGVHAQCAIGQIITSAAGILSNSGFQAFAVCDPNN